MKSDPPKRPPVVGAAIFPKRPPAEVLEGTPKILFDDDGFCSPKSDPTTDAAFEPSFGPSKTL